MERKERQKNQEIRNILTVLGSAILSALLLAFALIYYYSPSGLYIAGNTLLNPAMIEQMGLQGQHPKGDKRIYFVFDPIEFSYENSPNQIRRTMVPLEVYRNFYTLIASEKSLREVKSQIQDLFIQSHPAVLSIKIHTVEDANHSPTKIFQNIQFVSEDYFRVELNDKPGEWAYFYQPHIYTKMMELFNQ